MFAAFQKDPVTLVVHEGVGHDKLSDLRGKPIRLPAIARTNYWPWLKSRFGFTDEQIRGFEPGYAALGSDKMLSQQGYATNDGWNARKVGLNLKSLILADYGWANYATTVDTMEKTIKERPEVVRAFVHATSEGWKRYLENPAKAHAAIKQANPQMDSDLMEYSHREMKRQGIVDSWPADVDDSAARRDWGWQREYDMERAFDEYLVPAVVKRYAGVAVPSERHGA